MAVIYHPDYLLHSHWPGHPERPERLEHIVTKLSKEHLFSDVIIPEPADISTLLLSHPDDYVAMLENFGKGYLDPDTYMHEKTFDIIRLAVSGSVLAANTSYTEFRPTIALPRPPGHHAGKDFFGGFCYVNNIGIAAESLLQKTDAKKIAILDIDGHHGNGTEDLFKDRPDVLYISTHHYGIFPGTGPAEHCGEGAGCGFNVNIPFVANCGDFSFEKAWFSIIEPVISQFSPDCLLVSLGTDSHYMDSMTGLTLSSPGYLRLAKDILTLGKDVCSNRTAFFLEGGYHLTSTSEVVAGIVAAFKGKGQHVQHTEVYDDKEKGIQVLEKVVDVQSQYWNLTKNELYIED